MENKIKYFLLFSMTFLVFYFIFLEISFNHVLKVIIKIDIKDWIMLSIITATFPIINSFRWYKILKVMNINIYYMQCLKIIMGINSLNIILPSKSGDFLKFYPLKKYNKSINLVGSIIFERILDVIILSVFSIIALIKINQYELILIPVFIICIIIASILLLHLFRNIDIKISKYIRDFLSIFNILLSKPKEMISLIALSILNWLTSILLLIFIFKSVHVNVSSYYIFAFLPLSIFIGLIPITISGMGTRDSAMLFLFSSYIVSESILAASLLYTFFSYIFIGVIGLPFINNIYHQLKKGEK